MRRQKPAHCLSYTVLELEQQLLQTFNAGAVSHKEILQALWSGYGHIVRYTLEGSLPAQNQHPRGWDSDLSQQRKLRSYQIETHWYQQWAQRCQQNCRVANCYGVFESEDNIHILLEDLDAAGFGMRHNTLLAQQTLPCLNWLANFHARFLHNTAQPLNHSLWPQGSYWHLDTRPDELAAMADSPFKQQAKAIDQALKQAKYQTLIHGDAKLANFCFNEKGDRVAAVDFQYVGNGCGMKDVAYFLGSCLSQEALQHNSQDLLNYYFDTLSSALNTNSHIDADLVVKEWRDLYELAWADFHRFILGWSPQHKKNNPFSEQIALNGLNKLPKLIE